MMEMSNATLDVDILLINALHQPRQAPPIFASQVFSTVITVGLIYNGYNSERNGFTVLLDNLCKNSCCDVKFGHLDTVTLHPVNPV